MVVQFPLGNDRFSEIRQNGDYYVDKTQFIRELLSDSFKVSLVARPRRFGKTLTMTMLEDFFDIGKDSRADFEGLAVCGDEELCTKWMNQWPVIFVTLKSVEGNTFEWAFDRFKILMANLCRKYAFLEHSELADEEDRRSFHKIKAQEASDSESCETLYLLTRMMCAHYGKPAILLIDEYDVPLAKASENGYYREMLQVIRTLFGNSLKSNEYLKFAVVTGCLKVAKESIFTGTNNFVSDTISGDRFAEYIGFTEGNVQKILEDAGFPDHAGEVREWYDGYRFGSVGVYCPWDVLNHVAALQSNPHRKPQAYWENTSHNGIIRTFIERKDLWEEEQINEDFETLLAGGSIRKRITENLTYDMLHSSADNLWSLLYLTGYLTQAPEGADIGAEAGGGAGADRGAGAGDEADSGGEVEGMALKIPNEEIRRLFRTTVREWFRDKVRATDRTELFAAIWGQDVEKCQEILSKMIFDTISYNDYKEDFYHAFVAGVLSFAGYKVKSNAEAGEGRPDIVMTDEREGRAIIAEVKRSETFEGMEAKCQEALGQIRDRRYAEALGAEYGEILCYGICFYRKRCRVRAERYRSR